MARVLRVVAVVAGIVSLAFGIPAALGVSVFGISAATSATISAVASAISAVATMGARLLQKPPEMKGTVNEVVIGANMPVPYGMGRSYVGGFKVYDDSSDGSDNDERTMIMVGSHAGPIEGFENFLADYIAIPFPASSGGLIYGEANGYYNNFMFVNSRKGTRPDTALSAPPGATGVFRGWGASHKLSGMACWSVTMEFDEKGKRYAGGIPAYGMVAKWVHAYDPRKDGTYPGGTGTQRWNDESTWTWTENAGLHALTYARGRFMNGIKVVGAGIPQASIDIPAFVELANLCDANNWKMGGFVYEGPGISKWDNLKRILDAAAAKPVWVGGILTLAISAPKVALDTVTFADLAEGEITIAAMSPWKDKFNTIIPRYRSEGHRWEYVQADAVTQATYVTEDGEVKSDERQYDLIQDKDLAAQRAAYDLVNEREFGPIKLPLKPRLRLYRPGEALLLDLPELGLIDQLAVISSRMLDPTTACVVLEFFSETTAKHAYALGRTGVAPPTPSLTSAETVDTVASNQNPVLVNQISQIIAQSYPTGLTYSITAAGLLTISAHYRVYIDKDPVYIAGPSQFYTTATAGDVVVISYDQQDRSGGTPFTNFDYIILILPGGVGDVASMFTSGEHPYRHYVCSFKIPASGSLSGGSAVGSGGGTSVPGGWSTVLQ
jgi:hypothetical protein